MRLSVVGFVLLITSIALLAGLGCKGDTVESPEPVGELLGINLFEQPLSLKTGQVHIMGATGLYPGGATYNITKLAEWTSSNPDIIEVLAKGMIRGKHGGTATISVTYRGITKLATIEVYGTPLPPGPAPTVLQSIKVEPTWVAVKIGNTVQFTATAVYSDGSTQPITGLVDWRVSDTNVGFIIDADNANAWGPYYGLFKATGPVGATVVSAEFHGIVSNFATVVVRQY